MTLRLSEKQVTEQVCGWLKAHRWYCVRKQSGLFYTKDHRPIRIGEKGIPDWLACNGPRYFWLELKAPGKKLSDDQQEWFRFAEANHIPALWADGLGAFLQKFAAWEGV